jgi:nicotinate-nucleotide adenylyltransferase
VTGPVIARTEFGITDEAVLSAIRYHTTGKAGMTLLEKIIYVADFISEERSFPGVEQLRVTAFENLDDAVFAGLAFTLQDLTAKGKPVHPDTVAAYNEQAFVLAWARQHAKQEREDRT